MITAIVLAHGIQDLIREIRHGYLCGFDHYRLHGHWYVARHWFLCFPRSGNLG